LKVAAGIIALLVLCVLVVLRAQQPEPVQDIRVEIPKGWQRNTKTSKLGGPISLNNFNSEYIRGGIVPPQGAEIDVATAVPPQTGLADLIRKELQGAAIDALRENNGGLEVTWKDEFGPDLIYSNSAFYIIRGSKLYKFFMSYRAGDKNEVQLLADFKQVVASAQFGQR
jgi:hypothetical protein